MAINKIKLEKEMHGEATRQGLSFSQFLEKQDPTEAYGNTKLAKLDAFQRQMLARGITGQISLESFLTTDDSKILYPEFINRAIIRGMERTTARVLNYTDLIAGTETISAMTYEGVYIDETSDDPEMKRIAELAKVPAVTIKLKGQAIKLQKVGRAVNQSYESLKFRAIDIVALIYRRLGMRLAKAKTQLAVETLLNGDGNSNGAYPYTIGTSPIGGTAGTWSYKALLDFNMQRDEENDYSVFVGSGGVISAIMNLDEFKDSRLFDYQKTGGYATPFGLPLKKCDYVTANALLSFDQAITLNYVTVAGASLVESEKIISNQSQLVVVTDTFGWNIMERNAKILNKG